MYVKWLTQTKAAGTDRHIYSNSVCLMLAVTEYITHQSLNIISSWEHVIDESSVSVTLVCIKTATGCTNTGVSHTQTTHLLYKNNRVLLSDEQEELFYSSLSVYFICTCVCTIQVYPLLIISSKINYSSEIQRYNQII